VVSGSGLRDRLPYEMHLALRYLRVHRGRTFLSVITVISVAGVAVGTAALVIALALMSGFVEDVRSRIFRGGAHLTVVPAVGRREFEGASDLLKRTEALEPVLAAAPILYAPAMIVRAEVELPAFAEIHGVDPLRQARVTDADPAADPYVALAQRGASGRAGIVLGRELARRLGAAVGDSVRVIVPHVTLSPWGPVPYSQVFDVVGTYASEHFDEDAQRAYLAIDDARRLLHAPEQSSWIEVRLRDWRRLQPAKSALAASLGPEWLVVDLVEQNRALIRAMNTEKLLLFLAIGLIVVVAALNIVSTLILMVSDKVKEIGTLCAMGAEARGIATVFVLQGLIIGAVGTAVGLVVGTAAAIVLDRYHLIPLNPEVYYLSHVPFAPRAIDVLTVGLAALAVSLVATLYPAWKASQLDPVEAIRHE
jgi:lipoprotein-releasing system permease protein